MPNIKSAKKRVLVSELNYLRNKAVRSNLKTMIKKAEASIADNAADKAAVVNQAIKTIDKAAAKGILHKNCAARKKSALICKLNKAG
ncbi:MAG: 30S ribosomal protein S20 [Oscillospiraceae bacterium]|nr:30S ribosomal protein S20 [Oscillospiraceae bacterium]MBQ5816649.1 30S ribosomal protein S20 [Oscillospiraceae bacterium]